LTEHAATASAAQSASGTRSGRIYFVMASLQKGDAGRDLHGVETAVVQEK
jgi:hypothetical protein